MGGSQNLGKLDFETQLNTRTLDFKKTFDETIDRFEARGVKLVVLTGDSYDVKSPNPSIVNVFSECLMRAVNKGMRLLLLVGNHDQQRASSTTSVDVFNALDLKEITSFPEFSVFHTKDGDKDVNIVMMPYRDKNMIAGALFPEQATAMIRQDVQKLIANLKGTILGVTHFMIHKTITGETSEIFSINELVLPLDTFDGLTAVIGGHVHKHEVLRKDPLVMYVGSMEKISFGEKDHTKVSVVFDTADNSVEIIPTPVRELFEINLDYSTGDKEYKAEINDKIITDIDDFEKTHILADAIVKLVVKIKENDAYHISQERLREYILNKKVNHLAQIQVSTVSSRTLRNKEITEDTDSKKAITSFINTLPETDTMKKKLQKCAETIIEECDGK